MPFIVLVAGGAFLAFSFSSCGANQTPVVSDGQNHTQQNPPRPLSAEEVNELIERGEAEVYTVSVRNDADVSRIRATGVALITREPRYIVTLGDRERAEAMTALGLPLRTTKEEDYRYRPIKVWIERREQIQDLQETIADLWPIEDVPGYAYGRALDYQIDALQNRGYRIEPGQ